MLHREVKPGRDIANHVECFWQVDRQARDPQTTLLLIPEGIVDVLFCDHALLLEFGGDGTGSAASLPAGAWVIGQKTQCCRLVLPVNAAVFGIRVKPFAVSCVSRLNPKEFRNSCLPFDAFARHGQAQRVEQLCTEKTFSKRATAAELLMKGILETAPPFSPLTRAQVNYVLDRRGSVRLEELRAHFDISRPTLCSRFIDQLGLMPKELGKIWQFNHFMMLQARYPDVGYTELSLRAGYYDQSHLINDFKGLFNRPPAKYFRREAVEFNFHAQSIERRFSDLYPAVG